MSTSRPTIWEHLGAPEPRYFNGESLKAPEPEDLEDDDGEDLEGLEDLQDIEEDPMGISEQVKEHIEWIRDDVPSSLRILAAFLEEAFDFEELKPSTTTRVERYEVAIEILKNNLRQWNESVDRIESNRHWTLSATTAQKDEKSQ